MLNLNAFSLKKENFFPSLLSVLAPLLQILTFLIVGISETINISQFFLFADLLIVVNINILLCTLAGIGIYWHWRNNQVIIFRNTKKKSKLHKLLFFIKEDPEDKNKNFVSQDESIYNLQIKLAFCLTLSLLFF